MVFSISFSERVGSGKGKFTKKAAKPNLIAVKSEKVRLSTERDSELFEIHMITLQNLVYRLWLCLYESDIVPNFGKFNVQCVV